LANPTFVPIFIFNPDLRLPNKRFGSAQLSYLEQDTMIFLKPRSPRELPHDIAAWGEKVLPPDDPYRRIGDTLYAEIYTLYAEELAGIPTPTDFAPIDLAIILAFQELERLTAGEAAGRVSVHLGWKYALRLPIDHRGCTGRDLKTFLKRVQIAKPPRIGQVLVIAEMVRQIYRPPDEGMPPDAVQFWKELGHEPETPAAPSDAAGNGGLGRQASGQ
jgi:hypothetical protein